MRRQTDAIRDRSMTDTAPAPQALEGPSATFFSAYEINDLQERNAARRAEIEARTKAAVENAPAPSNEPPDRLMELYHKGGYWAGIFVLWFAFIAPNVYVASRLIGS